MQELSGYGRTPTREAAGRLIEDGLLNVVPRNGYQVTDLNASDAAALYDVFETLAPMTGRLAGGHAPDFLRAWLREMDRRQPITDIDDFVVRTEQIFEAVLTATGNPWLHRVGKSLFIHLVRLWVLTVKDEWPEEIAASYAQMLAALDSQDPDLSARAYTAFTIRTRSQTLRAVEHYLRDRTLSAIDGRGGA